MKGKKYFGILHNLNILTKWNLWIMWSFFGLSVLYDIILLLRSNQRIFRQLLTHYFNSIVFSIGSFDFVTFWLISLIDREIAMALFSDVNNPIIHCFPFILVLIEKFLVYHPYFQIVVHLIGIVVITAAYQATVLFLRTNTVSWAYLVFDSSKFNSRLFFFLSMWPMIAAVYISGAKINELIWKNALSSLTQS
uniref:Uncharacterized protein n=1 Tax=Octopus bimaculoides TaxID=37653 RepID=A0A0L8IGX2_OCTBM